MNEQRELMWQSFKDSNRGTESFLHKDENGNFDRRNIVSNNGSLYRQLYEEYGGRPTKTEFNEALNDVLANGQNSKYYDGFREFDHDGERSVFGFSQGNEDIDTILDLKDEVPEPPKAEIGAEKPIEPLEPVQPVGLIEPVESAATKTDGRSYEKETESLPEDFDVKHYVTDQKKAQNQSSKTCALREGVKINKKGQAIGYDIANIKESSTYHLDDQPQVRKTRTQSRTPSISQNNEQKTPAGELSGESASSLQTLLRPAGSACDDNILQNDKNINTSPTK